MGSADQHSSMATQIPLPGKSCHVLEIGSSPLSMMSLPLAADAKTEDVLFTSAHERSYATVSIDDAATAGGKPGLDIEFFEAGQVVRSLRKAWTPPCPQLRDEV